MADEGTNASRRSPVVGLTMTPEEVELVDLYQKARGLPSRSKALHELVRYAFGYNLSGRDAVGDVSTALDEVRTAGPRQRALQEAKQLQQRLLESYRSGSL